MHTQIVNRRAQQAQLVVYRERTVRNPQITLLLPTVETADMLPCPQGPELHSSVGTITQQWKERRKRPTSMIHSSVQRPDKLSTSNNLS